MLWNAVLLALREIRRNLMRSFLTILGIGGMTGMKGKSVHIPWKLML